MFCVNGDLEHEEEKIETTCKSCLKCHVQQQKISVACVNPLAALRSSRMFLAVWLLCTLNGLHGEEEVPPDVLRDASLNTPELIAQYGYPVEVHTVQTEDGYLLSLHRIFLQTDSHRPPVLLQHGLLCSSADWVVTRPGRALGYLLADAGYDVWMGNFRGNTYSRNHVKYSNTSKEFWDFSWHENGVYDLPAMIDYVLTETGSGQLMYVGHSMGTTSFFVLTSLRPEYNDKILLACCLAPVAFLNHMRHGVLKSTAFLLKDENFLLNDNETYEVLPSSGFTKFVATRYCGSQSPTQPICKKAILSLFGYDSLKQTNQTQIPVFLAHTPAGASTKQIVHYMQEVVSGRFCMWDYGYKENPTAYGTLRPPAYDLSQVTVPTVFFLGQNDVFVTRVDVIRLQRQLRHHLETITVPLKSFSHLDFLWAKDGKELLYDALIQKLNYALVTSSVN